MNNLYLSYQMHDIDHLAAAEALVWNLLNIGYQVHLPVNHDMNGVLDGYSIKMRDYDYDMAMLQHADIIIICVKGNDFTGAELDLGFVLALKESGFHSPNLFVCDLQESNPHPLGELYTGSLIERTATIGGVDKHARRIESVAAMLGILKERLANTQV